MAWLLDGYNLGWRRNISLISWKVSCWKFGTLFYTACFYGSNLCNLLLFLYYWFLFFLFLSLFFFFLKHQSAPLLSSVVTENGCFRQCGFSCVLPFIQGLHRWSSLSCAQGAECEFWVRRMDCAGQGHRMSVTQLLWTGFLLEQGQLVVSKQILKK